MNANTLYTESLKLVQSNSIRSWAQTDHNKPLWLEICQNAINNKKFDPSAMAAYMVAVAMGM